MCETYRTLSLLTVTTGQATERVTFYHNDALGSPVAATDANGTLLWRESYAPYGKRLTREAGSKDTVWYTGKPEDVGLIYFGARWYDPDIGRFMAMDPIGFDPENIHSFGRYAYANDNPYKFHDPDGNSPLDIGFFIADSIRFAIAVNSGDSAAIQSAAADLVGSAIGLISPVPGTGQLIKGARAGSKLAKIAKKTPHKNSLKIMGTEDINANPCKWLRNPRKTRIHLLIIPCFSVDSVADDLFTRKIPLK
jgi:RHS repeat-associated protein